MALVYSVVAREKTVLAEWSEDHGNFATITRLLLSKLWKRQLLQCRARPTRSSSSSVSTCPSTGLGGRGSQVALNVEEFRLQSLDGEFASKSSFIYDAEFAFHTLADSRHPALVFLVMAKKSAGVEIPYKFLEDLSSKFIQLFGYAFAMQAVAHACSASFNPMMKDLQTEYNIRVEIAQQEEPSESSKVEEIRTQIAAAHEVMLDNVDALLARTEKIDLLVDKAEKMTSQSLEFRRQAHNYQIRMWWRHKKLILVASLFAASVCTLVLMSIFHSIPFVP